MSNADLLLKNASQLITLSGENHQPRTGPKMSELGIVENGGVAVRDGQIIALGSCMDHDAEVVIDCTEKVVMPGFVDPHTHLVFAGSRENELGMKLKGISYLDILDSGGGIQSTMRATREASIEQLVSEATGRLDTMLDFGTTTVEAKSGYGLNKNDEIKMLEAIKVLNEDHPIDLVPTFLGAHAVPPEYKGKEDDFIELMISILPDVKDLAEFCDIFCEKGVFTVEQSRRLLTAAKDNGLKPKIHADEIENLGGSALAAELGAISAEHLAVTTEDQMRMMADAGVIGVLLPGTPYALMEDHYPDARKMIERGVPVAIATDLNPNCWTESMQFIISLACYKMKMTPEEAIVAATINAAHAVNRAHLVGSIEVGKQADLIILNVPNYQHIPYHFGINHVSAVIKNGEIVVYDGHRLF